MSYVTGVANGGTGALAGQTVNQIVLDLGSTVTPVKIGDFTAANQGVGVLIGWTAVSEYKNAGFNLYRRAVGLADAASGCEPAERMMALNNLAFLYRQRGEVEEAKHLFTRALAAMEAAAGPQDPALASVLRNLAVLYEESGDRSSL